MGLEGVGAGAGASAAAAAAAGSANEAVGVTMLRRSLDASQSSAAALLQSLPKPGQTVGSTLDVRL